MYCLILHGVPPERYLSAPPIVSPSVEKYADRPPDKILYVNPDCVLQVLIDYIRKELSIDSYDDMDLCNLNGDLLNISDFEPYINAMTILEPYTKYICVLKYKNEEGLLTKLTPLVSSIFSDISLKLRRHIRLSKRLSSEFKREPISQSISRKSKLRNN